MIISVSSFVALCCQKKIIMCIVKDSLLLVIMIIFSFFEVQDLPYSILVTNQIIKTTATSYFVAYILV